MGVGVDGGACGGGRPRAQEEEAPKGVAPLLWSAPTVLRSGGVAPGPSSPELVTMCAMWFCVSPTGGNTTALVIFLYPQAPSHFLSEIHCFFTAHLIWV